MRIGTLAAFAAIPLVLIAGCGKPDATLAGKVVVNVSVTCPDNSVQVSISPYIATVPEDAELEWKLNNSPNVVDIEIQKKQGNSGGWPFTSPPPYRGNAQNPPKVKGIPPGQVGKKFRYNIAAVCTPPGQEPRNVIIDPDMIIVKGGGNVI